MFDIGTWELLLILFIALLVFGPRRLPDLGRKLGQATSYLRRASREMRDALEREVAVDEVKKEADRLGRARDDLERELRGIGSAVATTVSAGGETDGAGDSSAANRPESAARPPAAGAEGPEEDPPRPGAPRGDGEAPSG
jgi:Tat protein translocase TatB subunit